MSIMDFVKLQHISGNQQATCTYRAVSIRGLHTNPEPSPLTDSDFEALHQQKVTAKALLQVKACLNLKGMSRQANRGPQERLGDLLVQGI